MRLAATLIGFIGSAAFALVTLIVGSTNETAAAAFIAGCFALLLAHFTSTA